MRRSRSLRVKSRPGWAWRFHDFDPQKAFYALEEILGAAKSV